MSTKTFLNISPEQREKKPFKKLGQMFKHFKFVYLEILFLQPQEEEDNFTFSK